MNVLVTGASGLVGSALTRHLRQEGHRVVPLRRTGSGAGGPCWNPDAGQIDLAEAGALDGVVHLAGESIGARWSAAKKIRIRESRVNGTRLLCGALARLPHPPQVLIAASAVGFYGDRGEELLDEASVAGSGFLAEVCREWEAAAGPAVASGMRVVHLRIGVVLAPNGGALAKMLPAFRCGLGGRLGDGRQFWSWITLDDLTRAIHYALTNESLRGPVNAVSPQPVTNREFTQTLGAVLRRPTFFAMPACAVRLLFGQMGKEALLAGARVRPGRLMAGGFAFQSPELKPALRQLLGR